MNFDHSNIAFSTTKSWIICTMADLWLAGITELGYESLCQPITRS